MTTAIIVLSVSVVIALVVIFLLKKEIARLEDELTLTCALSRIIITVERRMREISKKENEVKENEY